MKILGSIWWALFLLFLSALAYRATSAEGPPVKILGKLSSRPAVLVKFAVYEARRGDQRTAYVRGALVSNLPTRYAIVRVRVDIFREAKVGGVTTFYKLGEAEAEVVDPLPGKSVEWRAPLEIRAGSGAGLPLPEDNRLFHAVTAAVEPHR